MSKNLKKFKSKNLFIFLLNKQKINFKLFYIYYILNFFRKRNIFCFFFYYNDKKIIKNLNFYNFFRNSICNFFFFSNIYFLVWIKNFSEFFTYFFFNKKLTVFINFILFRKRYIDISKFFSYLYFLIIKFDFAFFENNMSVYFFFDNIIISFLQLLKTRVFFLTKNDK